MIKEVHFMEHVPVPGRDSTHKVVRSQDVDEIVENAIGQVTIRLGQDEITYWPVVVKCVSRVQLPSIPSLGGDVSAKKYTRASTKK